MRLQLDLDQRVTTKVMWRDDNVTVQPKKGTLVFLATRPREEASEITSQSIVHKVLPPRGCVAICD